MRATLSDLYTSTIMIMRKHLALVVLVCISGAVPSSINAQNLITDRPDFTESAVVVNRGVIQLEAGATISSIPGPNDIDVLVVGEPLFRWGVADRLEARFQLPSYVRRSNHRTVDGISDPLVGVKYQIGPVGSATDLAAIGMVSIPAGSEEFTNDTVVPDVIFIASQQMSPEVSLGGQIIASLPEVDGERSFEFGATLVGATTMNNGLSLFVEFAVDVPEEGTAPILVHGGVAYPISPTLQVDFHGGFGLSESAPDGFMGLGFATAM